MSIIDESYEQFLANGSKKLVNYHRFKQTNNIELPSWIDQDKLVKINDLYNNYSYSIIFGHFTGLLLLLFDPAVFKTLKSTNKANDLSSTFNRYYYTACYVRTWYRSKLWLKDDDQGHNIIRIVRNMHENVSNKNNAGRIAGKDTMEISMKDMTITQWAFIGPLVLFPAKFGFTTNESDLEILIHFWAMIGHYLGIDDEYNLAIGHIDIVRKRCAIILEQSVRPNYIKFNPDSVQMCIRILESYNEYIIGSKYEAFSIFIDDELLKIERPKPKFEISRKDFIIYSILKFILQNLYLNYSFVRFMVNGFNDLVFFLMKSQWLRDRISKRLEAIDRRAQKQLQSSLQQQELKQD